MMKSGPITNDDIDYMIDQALKGECVRYVPDEELQDKVSELARDHGAHDPQALREEGYAILREQEEISREVQLKLGPQPTA